MTEAGGAEAGGAEVGDRSVSNWSVVGLLTVAYLLSFLDRQMLALLIGPIERSLKIGDTAFSLLVGLAFSAVFALGGVPLARLSDRFPRNRVIAAGIFVWSIGTVACGLSTSYAGLFAARMLVGLGEAALTPAAYALFADLFAPAMLARAIAVFSTGSLFGAAAALLGGGTLVAWLSSGTAPLPLIRGEVWPTAFVLLGLPGLVLAPVLLAAVRDPRTLARAPERPVPPTGGGVVAAWRGRRRFLIAHAAGFTAHGAAFFATMAWLPAVVARRFAEDPAAAGRHCGLLTLVACPIGTLGAGMLIDRLSRGGRDDAPLLVAILAALAMLAPAAAIGIVPTGPALDLALGVVLLLAPSTLVTATTALQRAVPPAVRAQTTALFLLIVNLVGQTGSISAVALATDRIFHDPLQVHRALAAVLVTALLLSLCPLALARRFARQDAVTSPGSIA